MWGKVWRGLKVWRWRRSTTSVYVRLCGTFICDFVAPLLHLNFVAPGTWHLWQLGKKSFKTFRSKMDEKREWMSISRPSGDYVAPGKNKKSRELQIVRIDVWRSTRSLNAQKNRWESRLASAYRLCSINLSCLKWELSTDLLFIAELNSVWQNGIIWYFEANLYNSIIYLNNQVRRNKLGTKKNIALRPFKGIFKVEFST
jgi:hypothetical protein